MEIVARLKPLMFPDKSETGKTERGAWSLEKRAEPTELKNFILCSKLSKSLKTTLTTLTNMLSWNEIDQMNHFAWGVGNKRCRGLMCSRSLQ